MKPPDVTELLLAWNQGSKETLDQIMPLVSAELKKQAQRYLYQERQDHTLQPTALVNEVYLRLIDRRRVDWQNRAHFFAFAARTMRRILVDHARAQARAKRGGGVPTLSLDEAMDVPQQQDVEILALDEALKILAERDERQSRVVELRFFAGLSIPEVSAVLEISEITVSRDWAHAKAWLFRELRKA